MISHNLREARDLSRHLVETIHRQQQHLDEVGKSLDAGLVTENTALLRQVEQLRTGHAKLVDQVEGLKVELYEERDRADKLAQRCTVAEGSLELIRDWYVDWQRDPSGECDCHKLEEILDNARKAR